MRYKCLKSYWVTKDRKDIQEDDSLLAWSELQFLWQTIEDVPSWENLDGLLVSISGTRCRPC